MDFIGQEVLALSRFLTGRADYRRSDFVLLIQQFALRAGVADHHHHLTAGEVCPRPCRRRAATAIWDLNLCRRLGRHRHSA